MISAGPSSPHHQKACLTSLKTLWDYIVKIEIPLKLNEEKEFIVEVGVE